MNINIVIPMAGIGHRFKIKGYNDIKPMIEIGNSRMIELAIKSIGVDGNFIFIVNKSNGQSEELIQILNSIVDNPKIIEIDYLTEGPASSVLLAKDLINNNTPLLVANCDQIMEWDSNDFKNNIESTDKDGIVVTYNVLTEKNSYVKLGDDGNATLFAEKEIISEYSLNGIHFWKRGSDFIESVETMIKKNIRVNNEFYIAPTYNEMIIKNKKIGVYHIDKTNHWSVGTPDDLEKYLKDGNLQFK
jgi:NDP-sugar pyrophosphorylase family protein